MILSRLQRWYAAQCDGNWEHQYGVKIETLDNRGWLVKIDLTGTALERVLFSAVRDGTDLQGWPQSDRWIHCHVVNQVWQGAGDETKLECILDLFLKWAEAEGRQ